MRILYHHRTRSTDAQRIHILEMVRAFDQIGCPTEIASLVDTEAEAHNAKRDAGNPAWQILARRIPLGYDLLQLAYNVVGIPMLISRLWKSRFDALYERYSLHNFAGVVAARLFGKPIVLEVNSPFALEQTRDGDIWWGGLARWSERMICRLATRVVVVSTPLARIMAGCGVPPENILVLPNGVDIERFQTQSKSEELARRLGVEGRTVIGFVGWFRKWHGLEMLVDAFQQSDLAAKGVSLLLIGDGMAMDDLRAAVSRYALQDSVVFTGPLPHSEVPAYLNLIDVAVQPAANEYCCPMKILEYMALGKAIVAPYQDNITELLNPDVEALFFEPKDTGSLAWALGKVCSDAKMRSELGRRAFDAIEQKGFLWTKNAEAVVEALGSKAGAVGSTACTPVG